MTVLTHRISTGVTLAIALGAITAPGAGARLNLDPQPSNNPPPAASVRVVRVADQTGFDWGDAGIGAGGMAGLIAIGAGATLAAGGRRSRRSNPRPARVG